jgi:hypothetical protein|tara:strand:+ start:5450 stop:5782 length:333 start_codon:yes stop_codon:yes gene_type:complete
MFQMLSCFDLKPGISMAEFQHALNQYCEHLMVRGLLESCGPIGQRQRDTILDTDDERDQQFFMLMFFRDKAQSDKAVEFISDNLAIDNSLHRQLYSKADNFIFICWQDVQ